MVRILEERIIEDGLKYIEGACVDADVATLPTSGLVTGSKMICADSGEEYMFYEDETTPGWAKTKAGPTADG